MPSLVAIAEPDDPRVEPYRSVRERDLVGRQGLFLAEGETVLRAMLRGGRKPESVLLSERQAARLGPLLDEIGPEVPVYVAGQAVLDVLVGFHIHRGVLATGRRGPEPDLAAVLDDLPQEALAVVLVGVSNHDNVGGVFRNAAAFGVDLVLLDAACCDPLYRKAIRVSVGGALLTPFARVARAEAALAGLEERGFTLLALSPRGSEPLHRLARPRRAAVVLGAEGPGLPPDLLARTRTVRIEMKGAFDSLNVAAAGAIALHHLTAAESVAMER